MYQLLVVVLYLQIFLRFSVCVSTAVSTTRIMTKSAAIHSEGTSPDVLLRGGYMISQMRSSVKRVPACLVRQGTLRLGPHPCYLL